MMRALPPARADGLSHGVGVPSGRVVLAAAALGALALAPFGWAGLLAALAAGAAVLALARIAEAKVGGQTGDVCGAAQQVAEIAALTVLTAGLGG